MAGLLITMPGLNVGSSWLRGLVDFFFPPLCLGCGQYTDNEYTICDCCLTAVDTFNHPFCLGCLNTIVKRGLCEGCGEGALPLYAYGNYARPLEQIIIQYKFRGITKLSKLFARLLAERFGEEIKSCKADILLPVPLYAAREIRRGYNQAEILAQHLGDRLGIEVRSDLMVRAKRRRPQAKLNLRERAANIKGVFEICAEGDNNLKVILVDDVVTSGATMREAVRTLRQAGVKVTGAIAMAHAL
jgi:ComF family protein